MKNIYIMKNSFFKIGIILMILAFLGVNIQFIHATSTEVQQSSVTVKGTVIDDTGLPLIGVTVSEKGLANGTITDLDGNYTLKVQSKSSVVQFSFIGFVQQSVTVGDKSAINITMKEDLQSLEEVVVVGYGVQKKSHLTGSITKVRTDGIEDIPVSRLDQALQGRVAGVQIQNTTSEVGEAPQVRVRGMGSVSANSGPLVIIDGFPVEDGLGIVNTNDVESIEVLKDAASAAIYGSRAANGVILITTKSGNIDKPKYTFKTSWGTKSAYELHPIMSNKEYVAMRVEEDKLKGLSQLTAQDFAFSTISNETDWQKEGTRTANIYNAQLSISGGRKGLKYFVSGSYTSDEGIMMDNEFQKINLRTKIDADLSPKVKFGINLAPTYTKTQKPGTQFIDFYRIPSWMPVYHTEETAAITGKAVGEYAHGADFNTKDYTGIDPISGLERTATRVSPFNSSNYNPVSIMNNIENYQHDYRLQGSAYLDVNIIKGLDFRTSNGFDLSYREFNSYRNRDAIRADDPSRGLYQNRLMYTLTSENTLNYLTKINKQHEIGGLLGFSAQRKKIKTAGILGLYFPTDLVHTLNAASQISRYEGTSDNLSTGTWEEAESMASVFGRLTYSFEDKYLLSASLRTDGSSKFGEDNQWGWFPSVSLGWRLSEEKFVKDNVSWIDQLKFRASYGVTGTDAIENYASYDLLYSANYIFGPGNGTETAGLGPDPAVLGNPALQWEQTNEFNLGLDLSVLNNRIGLIVDYYYSKTKSLLFKREINSISGFQKNWTNLGKIRNKGIEIELTTYNIQTKDFKWNTSFNFSSNSNKVLDLGGPHELVNSGERTEGYRTIVGGPTIQFYGYKTIGVWKSQAEIDDPNNPSHPNDKPGGLRVWDRDGNGYIDDNDKMPVGDPFPDFNWGVTNNIKYRDFDLSFLFQGVQGIDVWNGDGNYNETRKWNKNYVKGRWIDENNPGDGKTPYFNVGIPHMETDYLIQDASYIALRDVTIGYTAPKKIAKKVGLSSLRVYMSVQNLGYWWTDDYKGVNPESRMTSGDYATPLISGYQRGGFPLQRTFNFGLDINF